MKSVSLTKVKTNLNSYLKTCGREPVLVTKNGRPIAALIAVVDPDELERLQLANSPKLDAIFEKALNDIRHGRGLTHDEVWSQVESWPESSARKLPRSPRMRESPKARRLS
jgi:prevent-host-death family protein